MSPPTAKTVAELVVEFLIAQGVDRVFGLQGGHIQPIWDWLARRGVRIVDVRDEGAAVHMAHAHAVLTGSVGIAMVTAGPGVTNCVTAMANASASRSGRRTTRYPAAKIRMKLRNSTAVASVGRGQGGQKHSRRAWASPAPGSRLRAPARSWRGVALAPETGESLCENVRAVNRYLPAPVIGVLAFLALVLNILFWFPFLMGTALVRVLLPWGPVVRACRRAAEWIAASWIRFNVAGLRVAERMTWQVTVPDDLQRRGWYLVTSNHRSAVDIVILQWLFLDRIPMLKFFLKRELFWVPLLGLAWWALEFPFMQRYPRAVLEQRPELRRRDLDTTRQACERFRDAPVSVLNFLEGTRYSVEKRDRQGSPYRHLLLPRAGGIAQVVSTLGDKLDAWLDVTIVYPGGTPSFWDLIAGQIPSVVVHVERLMADPAWTGRDYEADAAFRESFQAFVRDLWAAKDARIDELLGNLPAPSQPA
jgi:1-acyl-sn-glycerol-3-phosphate acyltransferase